MLCCIALWLAIFNIILTINYYIIVIIAAKLARLKATEHEFLNNTARNSSKTTVTVTVNRHANKTVSAQPKQEDTI